MRTDAEAKLIPGRCDRCSAGVRRELEPHASERLAVLMDLEFRLLHQFERETITLQ